MTTPIVPSFVIPSECTLGEGPVWDDRLGCLWWTDIEERSLCHWDWEARTLTRFALEERLGSFGLTSDPAWLVCAFASGFALYRPQSAELRWIERIEPRYRGIRLNDGRVDPLGRFWAGSMVENSERAAGATGSLYRLDPDGSVAWLFNGIGIANSICFTNDGRRLHFADSKVGVIRRFEVGPEGSLDEGEDFARTQGPGKPDGSDCDAQGNLWNAEWGAGRVTSYRPDGTVARHLDLPASQPSCVAFGGPDLDHLFVTTARLALTPEQLAKEPLAGQVLVYKVASTGVVAARFPLEGFAVSSPS